MKAFNKHLFSLGNIAFLQFETLEDEGFGFKPAGPALERGGLVIRESAQEGVVGKLLAINNTTDFLLLTDMDILKGSKQNRVVNTSMLIAPESKTIIDVSCVERLRWDYASPSFKRSDHTMDHNLRSAKAASISDKTKGLFRAETTQFRMWSMISNYLSAHGSHNPTEDYEKELHESGKSAWSRQRIAPEHSCNAIMIFVSSQVLALDLLGNRETFSYYFPGIRDSACKHHSAEKGTVSLAEAEAFYKLDEYLDELDANLEPSKIDNGVGKMRRDRRNKRNE